MYVFHSYVICDYHEFILWWLDALWREISKYPLHGCKCQNECPLEISYQVLVYWCQIWLLTIVTLNFCLSLCLFIHDTIIVCLGWLVRLEVMILMMIRRVVWYSWCCIISCAVKLLSPSIFWMFIVMSVANNSMNCFFVSSMVIWCTAGIKFVMFSTDGDTC